MTEKNNITYHVVDNHTLVYSTHKPGIYQVLGRKHNSNHKSGDILHNEPEKMRSATKKDFDDFRIDSKGHIKESTMENDLIVNILNKNYVDVQDNIYNSLAEKANSLMDSYKEQLAVDYFNVPVNEEQLDELSKKTLVK